MRIVTFKLIAILGILLTIAAAMFFTAKQANTKQVANDQFKVKKIITCHYPNRKAAIYKAAKVIIGRNSLNFVSVNTGMQEITIVGTSCTIVKLTD